MKNNFLFFIYCFGISICFFGLISTDVQAAELSGTATIAPVNVDLSTEGTVDWVHWGRIDAASVDRNANVSPQISNYVPVAGATPGPSSRITAAYSWSDGNPDQTITNTKTGLWVFNVGKGFEFTVQADTALRTLKVYVGANAARGIFEASLSDGSAPAYTSVVDQTSGRTSREVTLNYRAASAGQLLTVRYTLDTLYLPDYKSWVTLESAALQGGSNQPPILSRIGNKTAEEEQPFSFPVSATDIDGPAPLLLSALNVPVGANFSDLGNGSGVFSWTPLRGATTNNPYSITIMATDADGAVDQELLAINVTSPEVATKWNRWQRTFTSTTNYLNPYQDVTLSVIFTGPSGQIVESNGFWDGGNTFRIRFMFPEIGVWNWQTSSSDPTNTGLHGQSGSVNVSDYTGPNLLYTKGYLTDAANGRSLTYGDGTPFFWFADTAWSAPMNATQADWESFIDNRKAKKFNTVQLHIGLDVSDALDTVDINGNGPFIGVDVNDLSTWNPAFWQDYERKVQYANDQGIVIVILGVASPTTREPVANSQDILRFARNLAARFIGNFVVYSPGWDWPYRDVINEVGFTLRQAAPLHLVTQHPPWWDDNDGVNINLQTAERYYDQSYLDFSGLQTSAGWIQRTGYIFDNNLAAQNILEWIPLLYNRSPHKPVINLEAIYDSSVRHDPDDPYHSQVSNIYLPRMARSSAYWSVLSGSAGYTYGAGQIFSWGSRSVAPQGGNWLWNIAMDQASSFEMQYMYELFTSFEWWRLAPQQGLILSQQPPAWVDNMVLAKTDNSDLAIAYLPDNPEITIDMSAFSTSMQGSWFDPVNNIYQTVPEAVLPSGSFTYTKPVSWLDAVLVLQSTSLILNSIGNQTVTEGQPLSVLVSASDADGPAPLTLSETNSLPGNPSIMTDSGNGNGQLDWIPAIGDATGSPYSVVVTATDGDGNVMSETISITVVQNQAPALSLIGNQTVTEGQPLSVLVSASDADGPAPLTLSETNSLPGNPSIMTDSGNGNGQLDWTPAIGDAAGSPYSVVVTATDGDGNVMSETISITVVQNQAPALSLIGNQTVTEGQPLSVFVSASDADGPAPLTLSETNSLPGNPSIMTDSGNGNGQLDWTPAIGDAAGSPYSVTVTATDGNGNFSTEIISITVVTNQAPSLTPIGPQTVSEGQLLSIPVLASDIDGPAPLTQTETNNLPGAPSIMTDAGSGIGQLDWTPSFGDAAGSPYSVTVTATDGAGNFSSETISITVIPNQPPAISPIGPQTVSEGQLLSVPVSASDTDGPALLTLTETNTLPGAPTIITDSGGGVGQLNWTPAIGDSIGSPYSVTVTATDGQGNFSSETISITVNEPAASGSISGTPAITPATVDLTTQGPADWVHWGRVDATSIDRKAGVGTQITNYTPVGGATPGPTNRLVSAYSWIDGTPLASNAGTTTGLWVFAVAKGFEFTVPADTTPRTLKVYVGLKDARGLFEASLSDGSAPTYSTLIDQPSGIGNHMVTLTYQAASAGQTLTLRYTIETLYLSNFKSWATLESAALEGAVVNQAPTISPIGPQTVTEGQLLSIPVSASDADGPNPLILAETNNFPGVPSIMTDSGGGVGQLNWTTSVGDAAGSPYSVTVTATDGNGNFSTETISVTVVTNQAPILTPIGPQTVSEGKLLSIPVLASDTDGPAPLILMETNNLPGAPSIMTDAGSGIGQLDWTPSFGDAAGSPYSVTVTAIDGAGNLSSENISITVIPNQAPVINPIGPQTVSEGQLLSVLVSANDADGPAPLTLTETNNLPLAPSILTDSGDGVSQLDWIPAVGDAALVPYTVTVTATDGLGNVSSETISVTVVPNQAPALTAIGPQTVFEGQLLSIPVSASDPDGPVPLTLTETNTLPLAPSIITDSGGGSGQLDWTPAIGDAVGSPYSVTVVATDGDGNFISETISITVNSQGAAGSLSGTLSLAPATVNLTTEGAADWVHWGRIDATSVDRKTSVTPQISNYTPLAGATPSPSTAISSAYSWNDGTLVSSISNSRTGLWVFKVDKGFEFTVPADTTLRTLKVYIGAKDARGLFVATLSDGSAADYSSFIDQPVGRASHEVILNYQAASAGQTLTIRYTIDTLYLPNFKSWLSLESAVQ